MADTLQNSTYSYNGDNIKDYSDNINEQYKKLANAQADSVDSTVSSSTGRLQELQSMGDKARQENLQNANRDYLDSIQARNGVEKNNGNRQRIGHSQYGQNEISYDQQRANIAAQSAQLEKDITRQISDLRAQGDYEKADAALQNAQQQFQQLYTDALRRDTNLRSNYEYTTGLQREDAQIARTQEEADKQFAQKMGELLMSKGIMPEDSMLAAMGIDRNTAQLYINAVTGAMYGSGGGGGGSGRKKSSGSSVSDEYAGDVSQASNVVPDPWGTSSAYNNRIAKQVLTLASSGSLTGAKNWLNSNQQYFSAANALSLWKIAEQKAASASKNKTSSGGTQKTSAAKSTSAKKTTSSKSASSSKGTTNTKSSSVKSPTTTKKTTVPKNVNTK